LWNIWVHFFKNFDFNRFCFDEGLVEKIIDEDMILRITGFIKNNADLYLKKEAFWILGNLAAETADQSRKVIKMRCCLVDFIELLKSNFIDCLNHASFFIGKVAANSLDFRDMILNLGGLEHFLQAINMTTHKTLIKSGSSSISKLCRARRPLPKIEIVGKAIPTLSKIFLRSNDPYVLGDASWALFILLREENLIQGFVDTGAVPTVIQYLDPGNPFITTPLIRILGEILLGKNTEFVLNIPNSLSNIFNLLNSRHESLRKEICWIISILTVGNSTQRTHYKKSRIFQ